MPGNVFWRQGVLKTKTPVSIVNAIVARNALYLWLRDKFYRYVTNENSRDSGTQKNVVVRASYISIKTSSNTSKVFTSVTEIMPRLFDELLLKKTKKYP